MRLPTRLAVSALAVGAALAAGFASSSCLQIAGFDDFTFGEATPAPVFGPLRDERPSKMDVLLVIDESGSAAPALIQLVDSLRLLFGQVLNPPCVDPNGVRTVVAPTARCPEGQVRASAVVPDVHIGIVTTSLGGYGFGGLCAKPEENRLGRLFSGNQPTLGDLGFFVFNLADDPPGSADPDALAASIGAAVEDLRAANAGCGLEQQLEAAYHFLADPDPRLTGAATEDEASPDEVLLAQRAAFLREDSVVFVVIVSEEDDQSMVPNSGRYMVQPAHERPTDACETDPDGPCCSPCFSGDCFLETCDDPACADVVCPAGDVEHDSTSLLGWDPKRRYGLDPFWPVDRYVEAFSSPTLESADGTSSANPFLSHRRPQDVFFTAIAGVPWQEIARIGPDAQPDLKLGVRSVGELDAAGIWPRLLGDPPVDPHMITSPVPRAGLPGPGDGLVDPKHGHEYDTGFLGLQYACIGPLPESIPCVGCPCDPRFPDVVNPVCEEPSGAHDIATQRHSFGYPGTRFLEVARALGDQAIIGSICAPQVDDPTAGDYGFSPAIVGGISEKLKPRLAAPSCGPKVAAGGDAGPTCRVLEARVANEGACDCPTPGRTRLDDDDDDARARIQDDPRFAEEGWTCYCEIVPVDGDGVEPCRADTDDIVTDENGYLVSGWCSLDEAAPARAALQAACSDDEGAYRFVGDGRPLPGAAIFIDCP